MYIRAEFTRNARSDPVSMRCPHCGKYSRMQHISFIEDVDIGGDHFCGQRICPDMDCRGHVFVIHRYGRVLASHPSAMIDFDRNGIPERILSSFSEAVQCHAAGCYSASALMVRRTLEEICADKGAEGRNLKDKISSLRSKITVPEELLAAMDELRLLGNDAAHLEAQSYERVSSEEVEVAIEFAKELLKALYQYAGLLERLRSLKKLPQE